MQIRHLKGKYLGLPLTVLEFPPQKRTIKFDLGKGKQTITLSFPFMQFYYYAGNTYISSTRKPIAPGVKLYCPLLPNILWGDQLCLGGGYDYGSLKGSIEQFWNATFNHEAMPVIAINYFIFRNAPVRFVLRKLLPWITRNQNYHYALKLWSKKKKVKFYKKSSEVILELTSGINYA